MKRKTNKVIKHLKEDIKTFDKEKADDKKLIKSLKKPKETKKEKVIKKEMRRFKKGDLHSGYDTGPIVTNPKQAIAISLSVAKKKSKRKK